jgi:site-specific recombinase XerD
MAGGECMNTVIFQSDLALQMENFVRFKQLQGFDYTSQSRKLRHLDTFFYQHQHPHHSCLDQDSINAYISATAHLQANSRYNRLSLVREFSRYLHQFEPNSYILQTIPVKRPNLPRYYLYSQQDISALLRQAKTLTPIDSIRPHCFHLLIGLLYVTGIRIDEALSFNINDVMLDQNRLFIRKGKFAKDRYLVLTESTALAVRDYFKLRISYGPCEKVEPFFISRSRKRLSYSSASQTFHKLIQHCGIGKNTTHPPRLHDLRHTFATNCLLRWYEQGDDVNAKLPILATYMGHVNIASTQIYLHISLQLLEKANSRFHQHFLSKIKKR